MHKLVWALLAVSVPAVSAAPIFITISFIGSGSVAGFGFTSQTVTLSATADTSQVSLFAGPNRPAYAPPASLTISVAGFGTGTVTNISGVTLTNVESQSSGSFLFGYQSFAFLALSNSGFATWNLTTPVGPVDVSGDSTQGFVQLPNNDAWGTTGIGTSIGSVNITYAQNVVVTASVNAPGPVTVFSPAQGAVSIPLSPTLTWNAVPGTASYDVYFGPSPVPPFVVNTSGTSYTPSTLTPNTTYYWYLVSKNGAGSTTSSTWSFTTASGFSHPSFFTGESALSNGVYYLQFQNGNVFGYYNYQYFPTLFHYDLGFEYFIDANDGNSGAYLYDFASGHWFYTSPVYPFPYLYDFTLRAVLYYYPSGQLTGHYTTNPRYFYNYATDQVITM